MNGYEYRLAQIRQQDYLEEAQRRRIAREAMRGRMKRHNAHRIHVLAGMSLSRIARVFRGERSGRVDCNQSLLEKPLSSCQE